ncbi:hypothetical protein LEP1GSC016_4110 [Leptospira borgpetersenii serovar Hardjo-bovis str. Sponselee]|uniref:Uncharacterized protein n=1 Tax=Leptospira borgpetersenii serovar Hardjo-bovis str. Sponselee TaxID=1303729 RepID=M6CEP6_LEPBO|nr:hypothetical protein LBK6_09045 [Leptospira borgpetersenii serovar Hardjo]AWV70313.1 hypothetical protein B9T54_09840 [Leptospira borgpetersenii serovar Hardjo-bovis]EMJ84725.1 hypothetical protein LEP1GSC016_4110 [Leptospira borgpetersenii serovar Hardjo-bovis str. Sponselee]TQE53414.1 hypothetical protein FFZ95_07325 [Leptospira borgpetersenii]AMX61732.1 hypothetical protein LBK9_09070 [Leptospira borgpetersenii serovar Hardjo]
MIKKVHSKSVRKKTYRKCRTKNDSLFQEIKKYDLAVVILWIGSFLKDASESYLQRSFFERRSED